MKYQPFNDSASSQYKEWSGYEGRNFVPNPRQQIMVDAVLEGLTSGVYYTDDILAYVIDKLEITPEVATLNFTTRVEGGYVGMDAYYARNYLRAAETWKRRDAALVALAPVVGQVYGSLCFNYKRVNLVKVTEVNGDMISFTAKSGNRLVSGCGNALQIVESGERAFAREWRKKTLCVFDRAAYAKDY